MKDSHQTVKKILSGSHVSSRFINRSVKRSTFLEDFAEVDQDIRHEYIGKALDWISSSDQKQKFLLLSGAQSRTSMIKMLAASFWAQDKAKLNAQANNGRKKYV